ncbi:hypothetical protein [Thalassospira profundimaris]|uniref:hypothetical protein n=1 Tax=Thalassospira profundimaris TaxID=502049 RepID=UPI001C691439|nr:hypothetical protein [Thalassospira profundimaris]
MAIVVGEIHALPVFYFAINPNASHSGDDFRCANNEEGRDFNKKRNFQPPTLSASRVKVMQLNCEDKKFCCCIWQRGVCQAFWFYLMALPVIKTLLTNA